LAYLNMIPLHRGLLTLTMLFAAMSPATLNAQYFGQNKVRYRKRPPPETVDVGVLVLAGILSETIGDS